MASNMNELYLRANLAMKEQPVPPQPQVALESLLRIAHSMQETPFQWTFVDKPRAGESAIIFQDPMRPVWPADGIRYAQVQENITRTSVPFPSHPAGAIELETSIITQGIYPPANPNVPLPMDTPELNLARYRIRWRITSVGVGNPGLFLVYWGRDPTITTRAPRGWEREPIRRYPLPAINEALQFPLRINRQNGPPPPPPQWQQQQQKQPQLHPAHSQSPAQVPPSLPPPGQQQPQGMSPMAHHTPRPPSQGRQPSLPPQQLQQHASPLVGTTQLAPQPPKGNKRQNTPKQPPQTLPPNLRQSVGPSPQMPTAQLGQSVPLQGVPPQAAAQLAQQQQQQAAIARQMYQQQQHAQQQAQIQFLASQFSFPLPFNDTYDRLSERHHAGLRYEKNHALLAPIFDPMTCTELLTVWDAPQKVELDTISKQIAQMQAEIDKMKSVAKLDDPARQGGDRTAAATHHPNGKAGPNGSITSTPASLTNYQALFAPLPTVMSIAEMQEGAFQASAVRKQAIDQEAAVLSAQLEKQREEEEKQKEEDRRKKEQEEQERQRQLKAKEEEQEQERQRKAKEQQEADNRRLEEEQRAQQELAKKNRANDPQQMEQSVKTASHQTTDGAISAKEDAGSHDATKQPQAAEETERPASKSEDMTGTQHSLQLEQKDVKEEQDQEPSKESKASQDQGSASHQSEMMDSGYSSNQGQDFMDDSYLYGTSLEPYDGDGNVEESLFEFEYMNQMGDI